MEKDRGGSIDLFELEAYAPLEMQKNRPFCQPADRTQEVGTDFRSIQCHNANLVRDKP